MFHDVSLLARKIKGSTKRKGGRRFEDIFILSLSDKVWMDVIAKYLIRRGWREDFVKAHQRVSLVAIEAFGESEDMNEFTRVCSATYAKKWADAALLGTSSMTLTDLLFECGLDRKISEEYVYMLWHYSQTRGRAHFVKKVLDELLD